MTCGQVWLPILGICALQLIHPKCKHTPGAVDTHTPGAVNTHLEQSAAILLWRPESSWGFGSLLKGTSVVVLSVERALYIHSPHLQSLPARDLNSQPFNYKSDSLTIWPRLALKCVMYISSIVFNTLCILSDLFNKIIWFLAFDSLFELIIIAIIYVKWF